jgi:hypothetical protein
MINEYLELNEEASVRHLAKSLTINAPQDGRKTRRVSAEQENCLIVRHPISLDSARNHQDFEQPRYPSQQTEFHGCTMPYHCHRLIAIAQDV